MLLWVLNPLATNAAYVRYGISSLQKSEAAISMGMPGQGGDLITFVIDTGVCQTTQQALSGVQPLHRRL